MGCRREGFGGLLCSYRWGYFTRGTVETIYEVYLSSPLTLFLQKYGEAP